MSTFTNHHLQPSARDMATARTARRALASLVREPRPLTLFACDADRESQIELPAGAVALLLDILDAMAAGRGVTLVPQQAELTTVEAADILNVSRPFLIKLLDEGAIPHRKVGTHRRIRLEDVLAYKAHDDHERDAVLDILVREAQAQDMGYPGS